MSATLPVSGTKTTYAELKSVMRAIVKLMLIVVWLPVMMALTTPFWLLRIEAMRRAMARLTFKGVNAIFGLRVVVRGQLSAHRPLLLVSNHASYLDVLALGASLPIAFTPKKEIASWPVIGFCCRLAGCVFVERTPKAIAKTRHEISKRLERGRVMCVFAEGTTNDGTHLKPFKSSLFSLAELEGMRIQPLALHYHARNGERLDAAGRAQVAWYDDMALLPHLWRVLGYRRIEVVLSLLEVINPADYPSRKALCATTQTLISDELEPML